MALSADKLTYLAQMGIQHYHIRKYYYGNECCVFQFAHLPELNGEMAEFLIKLNLAVLKLYGEQKSLGKDFAEICPKISELPEAVKVVIYFNSNLPVISESVEIKIKDHSGILFFELPRIEMVYQNKSLKEMLWKELKHSRPL